MKLSARYGAITISALAALSLVHWGRGQHVKLAIVLYLIGVLPNFLAAIAIPFVPLGVWADQNLSLDYDHAKWWFIVATTGSMVGLIAWEFAQHDSRKLVFDPQDIGATFLGAGVAVVLFRLVTPRRARAPADC